MIRKTPPIILPFLFLSIVAMVYGLWGGLARLGWALPVPAPHLPVEHGPLMVSGFLGTLISLERVAAMITQGAGRRAWMVAAPLLSSAGWLSGLLLPHLPLGPALITVGSLATAGILGVMLRREPHVHTAVMAVGALSWLGGNLLWLAGTPIPRLVGLWAAFLVLTVAGERLELSRVLRPTPLQLRLFALAAAVFLGGALLSAWLPQAGARLLGAGLVGLCAWLVRCDIARRNLRHPAPLTRFIAAALFAGTLWLGAAGLLNLALGAQVAGPYYDAALHAVFVGFIFSMIFGHAPIILPALTNIAVPFHPAFYLPLALLHGSLVLRIAGDLAGLPAARMWGGLLNEVAVVGFMGLMVTAVVRGRRKAAVRASEV